MKLQLIKPFKGDFRFGQKFGNQDKLYDNLGLKGHNGLDWSTPEGTVVLAAHDGIVTGIEIDWGATKYGYPTEGYGVKIQSVVEYDCLGYIRTFYGHLQKGSIRVKEGDRVKAGDIIALSGNTGYSTGPHLHFQLNPVTYNGVKVNTTNGYNGAIDPLPYFDFGVKSFTKDMSYGMVDDKVIELQKFLAWFGFYRGEYINRFGYKTGEALHTFQKMFMQLSNGYYSTTGYGTLKPKPLFGPSTRAFINNLIK